MPTAADGARINASVEIEESWGASTSLLAAYSLRAVDPVSRTWLDLSEASKRMIGTQWCKIKLVHNMTYDQTPA